MSLGIFASGVVNSVTVLLENFTDVSEWTPGGALTSVAGGRTGNAGNLSGSSNCAFPIAAGNQSPYATVGLAYKVSQTGAAIRTILKFRSDTNTNDLLSLNVETNGSLAVHLGAPGGTILGQTGAAVVTAGFYNFIEMQAFIADAGGYITVRLNGTQVINVTGIDTKIAASSLIDTLTLGAPGAAQNCQYDDLYLIMGQGAAFRGDQTIP